MDPIDYIKMAGNKAKGGRPYFMNDPAVERVMNITMALAGEVAVMRERIDTLERLLQQQGVLDRAAIDTYTPDPESATERQLVHAEFVARILRIVQQEMEAIADPALDQDVKEIADDIAQM